jgi:hypothetical protein
MKKIRGQLLFLSVQFTAGNRHKCHCGPALWGLQKLFGWLRSANNLPVLGAGARFFIFFRRLE